MSALSSSVAGTTTVSGLPPRRSGVGNLRSSAVLMSAQTCQILNSSGTLRNLAKRVFIRNRVPSGPSSRSVAISPKVAAQVSKSVSPASSSRSGRRNRCIVYASATLLAIGVAVANVATRPPWRSRSQASFMSMSEARWEPSTATPAMLETVRRFL